MSEPAPFPSSRASGIPPGFARMPDPNTASVAVAPSPSSGAVGAPLVRRSPSAGSPLPPGFSVDSSPLAAIGIGGGSHGASMHAYAGRRDADSSVFDGGHTLLPSPTPFLALPSSSATWSTLSTDGSRAARDEGSYLNLALGLDLGPSLSPRTFSSAAASPMEAASLAPSPHATAAAPHDYELQWLQQQRQTQPQQRQQEERMFDRSTSDISDWLRRQSALPSSSFGTTSTADADSGWASAAAAARASAVSSLSPLTPPFMQHGQAQLSAFGAGAGTSSVADELASYDHLHVTDSPVTPTSAVHATTTSLHQHQHQHQQHPQHSLSSGLDLTVGAGASSSSQHHAELMAHFSQAAAPKPFRAYSTPALPPYMSTAAGHSAPGTRLGAEGSTTSSFLQSLRSEEDAASATSAHLAWPGTSVSQVQQQAYSQHAPPAPVSSPMSTLNLHAASSSLAPSPALSPSHALASSPPRSPVIAVPPSMNVHAPPFQMDPARSPQAYGFLSPGAGGPMGSLVEWDEADARGSQAGLRGVEGSEGGEDDDDETEEDEQDTLGDDVYLSYPHLHSAVGHSKRSSSAGSSSGPSGGSSMRWNPHAPSFTGPSPGVSIRHLAESFLSGVENQEQHQAEGAGYASHYVSVHAASGGPASARSATGGRHGPMSSSRSGRERSMHSQIQLSPQAQSDGVSIHEWPSQSPHSTTVAGSDRRGRKSALAAGAASFHPQQQQQQQAVNAAMFPTSPNYAQSSPYASAGGVGSGGGGGANPSAPKGGRGSNSAPGSSTRTRGDRASRGNSALHGSHGGDALSPLPGSSGASCTGSSLLVPLPPPSRNPHSVFRTSVLLDPAGFVYDPHDSDSSASASGGGSSSGGVAGAGEGRMVPLETLEKVGRFQRVMLPTRGPKDGDILDLLNEAGGFPAATEETLGEDVLIAANGAAVLPMPGSSLLIPLSSPSSSSSASAGANAASSASLTMSINSDASLSTAASSSDPSSSPTLLFSPSPASLTPPELRAADSLAFNALHNAMLSFTLQMHAIQMRDLRLREELACRTRWAVRSVWPSAVVSVVGSVSAGVALPKSDLDFVIYEAPPGPDEQAGATVGVGAGADGPKESKETSDGTTGSSSSTTAATTPLSGSTSPAAPAVTAATTSSSPSFAHAGSLIKLIGGRKKSKLLFRSTKIQVFKDINLIRLRDGCSGVSMDLWFPLSREIHARSQAHTQLIHHYMSAYPPFYPLSCTLKTFMQQCLLNSGYSGLGSYGILLMIVRFCQVHRQERAREGRAEEGNLGRLLVAFLCFYIQFDFEGLGLDVREQPETGVAGNFFDKSALNAQMREAQQREMEAMNKSKAEAAAAAAAAAAASTTSTATSGTGTPPLSSPAPSPSPSSASQSTSGRLQRRRAAAPKQSRDRDRDRDEDDDDDDGGDNPLGGGSGDDPIVPGEFSSWTLVILDPQDEGNSIVCHHKALRNMVQAFHRALTILDPLNEPPPLPVQAQMQPQASPPGQSTDGASDSAAEDAVRDPGPGVQVTLPLRARSDQSLGASVPLSALSPSALLSLASIPRFPLLLDLHAACVGPSQKPCPSLLCRFGNADGTGPTMVPTQNKVCFTCGFMFVKVGQHQHQQHAHQQQGQRHERAGRGGGDSAASSLNPTPAGSPNPAMQPSSSSSSRRDGSAGYKSYNSGNGVSTSSSSNNISNPAALPQFPMHSPVSSPSAGAISVAGDVARIQPPAQFPSSASTGALSASLTQASRAGKAGASAGASVGLNGGTTAQQVSSFVQMHQQQQQQQGRHAQGAPNHQQSMPQFPPSPSPTAPTSTSPQSSRANEIASLLSSVSLLSGVPGSASASSGTFPIPSRGPKRGSRDAQGKWHKGGAHHSGRTSSQQAHTMSADAAPFIAMSTSPNAAGGGAALSTSPPLLRVALTTTSPPQHAALLPNGVTSAPLLAMPLQIALPSPSPSQSRDGAGVSGSSASASVTPNPSHMPAHSHGHGHGHGRDGHGRASRGGEPKRRNRQGHGGSMTPGVAGSGSGGVMHSYPIVSQTGSLLSSRSAAANGVSVSVLPPGVGAPLLHLHPGTPSAGGNSTGGLLAYPSSSSSSAVDSKSSILGSPFTVAPYTAAPSGAPGSSSSFLSHSSASHGSRGAASSSSTSMPVSFPSAPVTPAAAAAVAPFASTGSPPQMQLHTFPAPSSSSSSSSAHSTKGFNAKTAQSIFQQHPLALHALQHSGSHSQQQAHAQESQMHPQQQQQQQQHHPQPHGHGHGHGKYRSHHRGGSKTPH